MPAVRAHLSVASAMSLPNAPGDSERAASPSSATRRAIRGQRSQIDFLVQLVDDFGGRVVWRDVPTKMLASYPAEILPSPEHPATPRRALRRLWPEVVVFRS